MSDEHRVQPPPTHASRSDDAGWRATICGLRPTERRGGGGTVSQVLTNEAHRHGALAHGRRDPLYGATTHVTGRENAGEAGLQQIRVSGRPTLSRAVSDAAGEIR